MNLKRPETWDRIFVAYKAITWAHAIFVLVSRWDTITERTREVDSPGFTVQLVIVAAGVLVLEIFSLRAIWNHRRWGFICQLALILPTLISLPTWGIRSWIQIPLVLTFLIVRLYQSRSNKPTLH